MRDKLRRSYQVQKEVTRNGYFEAEIALSELARLSALLYDEGVGQADSRLKLKFEFVRSEIGIPTLAGELETRLILRCQRCLKPLELPMKLDYRLLIDADDDTLRDNSVDTLYSDQGFIDIYEVVEDELMLAIPLVALHQDTSCNEYWQASSTEVEAVLEENPFSVLRQLKTSD